MKLTDEPQNDEQALKRIIFHGAVQSLVEAVDRGDTDVRDWLQDVEEAIELMQGERSLADYLL